MRSENEIASTRTALHGAPNNKSASTATPDTAMEDDCAGWTNFDALAKERGKTGKTLQKIARAAADAFFSSDGSDDDGSDAERPTGDIEKAVEKFLSSSSKSPSSGKHRRQPDTTTARRTPDHASKNATQPVKKSGGKNGQRSGTTRDDEKQADKKSEQLVKKTQNKEQRSGSSKKKCQNQDISTGGSLEQTKKGDGVPSDAVRQGAATRILEGSSTETTKEQHPSSPPESSSRFLVCEIPSLVYHIEATSPPTIELGPLTQALQNDLIVAEVFNCGLHPQERRGVHGLVPSASLSVLRFPAGSKGEAADQGNPQQQAFLSATQWMKTASTSLSSCLWTTTWSDSLFVTHLKIIECCGGTESFSSERECASESSGNGDSSENRRLLIIVLTSNVFKKEDSWVGHPSSQGKEVVATSKHDQAQQPSSVAASSRYSFTAASQSYLSIFEAVSGAAIIRNYPTFHQLVSRMVLPSPCLSGEARGSSDHSVVGHSCVALVTTAGLLFLVNLSSKSSLRTSTQSLSSTASQSFYPTNCPSCSTSQLFSTLDLRPLCFGVHPGDPQPLTPQLVHQLPAASLLQLAARHIHDVHMLSPSIPDLSLTSCPVGKNRTSTESNSKVDHSQGGGRACLASSYSSPSPKLIVILNDGVIFGFNSDYGIWDRLDDLEYTNSDFYSHEVIPPSQEDSGKNLVKNLDLVGVSNDARVTPGRTPSIGTNQDGGQFRQQLRDCDFNLRRLQQRSRSLNYGYKISVLNGSPSGDLGSLLLGLLRSSGLNKQLCREANRVDDHLVSSDPTGAGTGSRDVPKSQSRSDVPQDQSVQLMQLLGSSTSLDHLLQQVSSAAFLFSATEFLVWLRLLFHRALEVKAASLLDVLCDSLLDIAEEDMRRRVSWEWTRRLSEGKVNQQKLNARRIKETRKNPNRSQLSAGRGRDTWGDYHPSSQGGSYSGLNGDPTAVTMSSSSRDVSSSFTSQQALEFISGDSTLCDRRLTSRTRVLRWCGLESLDAMGLDPKRVLIDVGCKTILGTRLKDFLVLFWKEVMGGDIQGVDTLDVVVSDTSRESQPPADIGEDNEELSSQLGNRIFSRLKYIENKRIELEQKQREEINELLNGQRDSDASVREGRQEVDASEQKKVRHLTSASILRDVDIRVSGCSQVF